MSSKSSRGQLVFRSSLLYVWVTRRDHLDVGRLTKSLCDFGDMTPHTLVGGAQTTLTARPRASVRADRRNDPREAWGPRGDTHSRPPDTRGFAWTGARGSQGPSGRPATRGTIVHSCILVPESRKQNMLYATTSRTTVKGLNLSYCSPPTPITTKHDPCALYRHVL